MLLMNRRMPNGMSGGVGEGSRKAPFYPISSWSHPDAISLVSRVIQCLNAFIG